MERRLYREIVSILMSSDLYFDLTIEERHALARHIMRSSGLSPDLLIDASQCVVDIAQSGNA